MPELRFAVLSAAPGALATAPTIALALGVENASGEPVHGILLRCQVHIDPAGRRYHGEEQARLRDLFGEPGRWPETVRRLLWAQVSIVIPPFAGRTVADIPVPCSYDVDGATAKLFYAVDGGEVPLSLLFSGTVFHAGPDGALQATPVPWKAEATFRLPVRVWTETIERAYPNRAVLALRRDVFDRLYLYKTRRGLPTWEQAVEALLETQAGDAA